MRYPIYQVDAFADRLFAGNPAAVVCLPNFPDDATLQAIAAENNLSETAFLVESDEDYDLRWFTPTVEVPLCGHATLASAAVVMERLRPGREQVVFQTASGPLTVTRAASDYTMDFPQRIAVPVPVPVGMAEALGAEPLEVLADAGNYTVLLENAQRVRTLSPDLAAIARLDRGGVAVTADGDAGYDFVSRYFAPAKGIPEDSVTGGAHCALAPYWARRLGRDSLRAFQASRRGGVVSCRVMGERVELRGSCVFYLEGTVML
jgi:PhzF family phenazine biosynthesis protein